MDAIPIIMIVENNFPYFFLLMLFRFCQPLEGSKGKEALSNSLIGTKKVKNELPPFEIEMHFLFPLNYIKLTNCYRIMIILAQFDLF